MTKAMAPVADGGLFEVGAIVVAAKMDISDSAIYNWELNRKRPNDANLIVLCEILKLSLKATKAMATG